MQQQTTGNRIVYLDMLRILAILAVVLLHVYSEGFYSSFKSLNWYVCAIGDSLVRWSVPVFVMISGALFLHPQKHIPTKTLYKKYILRLFLVFVFWGLFYSAYFVFHRYQLGLSSSLRWRPRVHLWFLPMLMGVYALIPILRKIASNDKLLLYALILWGIYSFVGLALVKRIYYFNEIFVFNTVVGYSGYFLLGYYLSKTTFSKKQQWWIYILGLMSLGIGAAGTVVMSFIKGEPDPTFLPKFCPHVVLASVALFVFVKEHVSTLKPTAGRHVEHVSKDVFGIYLIHYFWLKEIDWSPLKNLCSPVVSLFLLGIVIFIISLCCTRLIRLIPLLRKVVE